VCGENNCGWFRDSTGWVEDDDHTWDLTDDCCTDPIVCGGVDDGCTDLGLGDGDCGYDSDCRGDLVCGVKNCGDFRDSTGWVEDDDNAWDLTDDCCMMPVSKETAVAVHLEECGGIDDGCTDLGLGDGDCGGDSDCRGDLVCGENNCGWFRDSTGWVEDDDHTWDLTDDCCTDPIVCGGVDDGCTDLGLGDGDCGYDSDCRGDLVCGVKNCGDFRDSTGWVEDDDNTWDLTDDCCMMPKPTDGLVKEAFVGYAIHSASFQLAVNGLALVGIFALAMLAFNILRPKQDYATLSAEQEI